MTLQEFRDYMERRNRAEHSKFKAIPTETADGQKFKSQLEATYYNRMLMMQKGGLVKLIEREIRYELIVNGVFLAAYMMDFRITYTDGRIEYVDCKSVATKTPLYMIKKGLMLALYGIELKEVFE